MSARGTANADHPLPRLTTDADGHLIHVGDRVATTPRISGAQTIVGRVSGVGAGQVVIKLHEHLSLVVRAADCRVVTTDAAAERPLAVGDSVAFSVHDWELGEIEMTGAISKFAPDLVEVKTPSGGRYLERVDALRRLPSARGGVEIPSSEAAP